MVFWTAVIARVSWNPGPPQITVRGMWSQWSVWTRLDRLGQSWSWHQFTLWLAWLACYLLSPTGTCFIHIFCVFLFPLLFYGAWLWDLFFFRWDSSTLRGQNCLMRYSDATWKKRGNIFLTLALKMRRLMPRFRLMGSIILDFRILRLPLIRYII